MLEGSKKPRISAHQCDVPISITSWMPRKDALPLSSSLHDRAELDGLLRCMFGFVQKIKR